MRVLDRLSGLEGVLLDMFAGSATSLLVAAERGLDSVGVELLPYAQWAADAVVRAHTADHAIFRNAVSVAADAANSRPIGIQPNGRFPPRRGLYPARWGPCS